MEGCSEVDTLGIEPRASRMLSGCDTTTPCALCVDGFNAKHPARLGKTAWKPMERVDATYGGPLRAPNWHRATKNPRPPPSLLSCSVSFSFWLARPLSTIRYPFEVGQRCLDWDLRIIYKLAPRRIWHAHCLQFGTLSRSANAAWIGTWQ